MHVRIPPLKKEKVFSMIYTFGVELNQLSFQSRPKNLKMFEEKHKMIKNN